MINCIDRMELPQWYDENKMVLLVVNPHTAYLYWELAFSQNRAVQEHQPVVRLFELPPGQQDEQPRLVKSIVLPAFTNNWYFNDLQPGCHYQAEMGWEQNGIFYCMIKSNNIIAPPAAPMSTPVQAQWRPVEQRNEVTKAPTNRPPGTVQELIQQMSFYMGINEAS
ncbi:DUF4912 domain-containing protein [Desulfoscipio gibsoniae]|uniref:DUF4912 domain-containing protein n=1 Tax=Desulfoscipio gibsoniae DSM 7213 TaxID=767817 RepID=R4KNY3_9FIRM|nr:DUF4912 domain-containing protein [Desulfoscipio gibsoniae]AGL03272.1 hypothetical protein Desgi_3992 [Desulfoscipio gibsoniae DSM 7213]